MILRRIQSILDPSLAAFFLAAVLVLLLAPTFALAVPGALVASENLGNFHVSEFSLRPSLLGQESSGSAFQLQATYLGFEWRKDENIRAELKVGSSDMIKPAVWFAPQSQPAMTMVEAYLEGKSLIGNFRAGLLNLHQGYEGSVPEWAWMLPPTRVRQIGWFVNRDFGFQFNFVTSPCTTMFSVSNGDSNMSNADSKFWYTGFWQIKTPNGYGFQVTAQVGQTGPASTGGVTPSVAATQYRFVFVPTADAKIRAGTGALFYDDGRNLVLFEGGSGDIFQANQKNSFGFGHVDLGWRVGRDLTLLTRWEQSQSNMSDGSTIAQSSSFGMMVTSQDKLQSFTIYGTRNQEMPEVPNDQVQFIFRLNSQYLN